uniref:Uncharacterized protein n=1 Tax=Rhizophora mucronata TaxID=61149 RepID=A0A2P2LS39_RHIMU
MRLFFLCLLIYTWFTDIHVLESVFPFIISYMPAYLNRCLDTWYHYLSVIYQGFFLFSGSHITALVVEC